MIQNTVDVMHITNTRHKKLKCSVTIDSYLSTSIEIHAFITRSSDVITLWLPSIIDAISLQ